MTEICGHVMEILWTYYGNDMEMIWTYFGNDMEGYGNIMDIYIYMEILWK